MEAVAALLAWYDRHRRDLPWRRRRDAYAIWVSEVMLQQTRVETVLPYFERFMERFPTVGALAAAPLEELLALWSGLGYYRRARQMHAAARQVAEAGSFPTTVEGLRQLPGIGEYTAAAVGSIAFGIAEPVLDGNVERVICRQLALDEDPRRRAPRRQVRQAAAELLDPERPGDSNQALMELGATLCTPQRPKCLLCPLRPGCRAARRGDPESFPPARRRRAVERQRRLVALAEQSGRVLLFRRPDDSELLAGTWELPWVELDGGGRGELRAAESALAARYGGRWRLSDRRRGGVRHGITYRSLTVEIHSAEVTAAGEVAEGRFTAGWFEPGQLAELPLSSLVGKVLQAAGVAAEDAAG